MCNKTSGVYASSVLAAILLAGAAPQAGAGESLDFAAELKSCVAAVHSRLDLDRAARVRHVVSNAKRTGIGYVLTIETSVFSSAGSEDKAKSYKARCVASGDNAPLRFRIAEVEI